MTRHPRRIRPSFGIESLEGRTLLSGSSHPSSSMTSQVHDVLVTFRPQSSPQRELDILEWSGAAVIADPASHTYLLAAGPGETLGTLIHRLESRTAVKSVKTVAAPKPTAETGANRQSDVLVTFRPQTTHKREQAILKSSHAAVVAATAPHTYLLAPGPGQGLKSLIHRLKSNSPVKSVRAVAAPNPSAGTVLPVTLPGITIPTPPIVTTPNSPTITTPNSPTITAPTVGDEVIVQFKTTLQGGTEVFTAAQQQQAAALIGSLGASVVASSPSAGFYVVAPASGSTPAATVAQLNASPLVGVAQPNYVYSTASGRLDDIGVSFQPGTTDQQVQALTQSLGETIVSPGHGTEIYLIAPAAGTDLVSALIALYASPLVLDAGQNSASSVNTQTVGDEVIVQFKTMFQGGTDVFTAAQQQQAAALFGSLGASVVASSPSAGFYVVAPAPGSTPAATVAQLDASPLVGRAQPNYVYSTASSPSDDVSVLFQPGTTDQQAQGLFKSLGDTIVTPGNGTESYLVTPAAGTDLASALAALSASPLILTASQNFEYSYDVHAASATASVADEVIVQFATSLQNGTEVFTPAQQQQAAALIGSLGASVVASSPSAGFYVVAPASGSTPAATVAQLNARPLVLGAKPNYIYGATSDRVNDIGVTFRTGTTSQQVQALAQSLGYAILTPDDGTEIYVVQPAAGTDLASALAALYASPLVVVADQDSVASYFVHAASATVSPQTTTSPASGSTSIGAASTADEIVVQFKTESQVVSGVSAATPQQPASQGDTGAFSPAPQVQVSHSVIQVLPPAQQQQAAALIGSLGASVVASSPSAGFYVVAPASGSPPAATVAQLNASPLVGRAQPNYVYSTASGRLDDITVIFQATTTPEQVLSLSQSLGETIVSPDYGTEIYLVAPAAGTDLASALAALYASPLVVVASQNFASSVNTLTA